MCKLKGWREYGRGNMWPSEKQSGSRYHYGFCKSKIICHLSEHAEDKEGFFSYVMMRIIFEILFSRINLA